MKGFLFFHDLSCFLNERKRHNRSLLAASRWHCSAHIARVYLDQYAIYNQPLGCLCFTAWCQTQRSCYIVSLILN